MDSYIKIILLSLLHCQCFASERCKHPCEVQNSCQAVTLSSNCYYIFTDGEKTWDENNATCKLSGLFAVDLLLEDINKDIVNKLAESLKTESHLWLGKCITLDTSNGIWGAVDCSSKRYALCQADPTAGILSENGGNNAYVPALLVFFLVAVPALIALGLLAFKYWKLRKKYQQKKLEKLQIPENKTLLVEEIMIGDHSEVIQNTDKPDVTTLDMTESLADDEETEYQDSCSEDEKDIAVEWPGPATFWDQGGICKINLTISGMKINTNPIRPQNAELMDEAVFSTRAVHLRIKVNKDSGDDVIYEYRKELPADIKPDESSVNFGFESIVLTLKKFEERLSWKTYEDLLIEKY